MKKAFLTLAFMLIGTLAFASSSNVNLGEKDSEVSLSTYSDSLENNKTQNVFCDFYFVFVSSCGTENVRCGSYNTIYYIKDLEIAWNIYDSIDC